MTSITPRFPINFVVNPPGAVTRTYQFYQSLMMVMARCREARINLAEVAIQAEENYLWIFGESRSIEQLSQMFNEVKIRAFLKLAALNR